MLRWRGRSDFGGAYLSCAVALARGIRLSTVTRQGMIYDSAFTPAEPSSTDDTLVLYILLSGRLWLRNPDQQFEAPAMILMPRAMLDGSDGVRARTFSGGGAPLRACQLHFPRGAWLGDPYVPGEVRAQKTNPVACALIYAAADRFETGPSDDAMPAALELIDHVLKLDWISYEVRPGFHVDWTSELEAVWHGVGVAWSRTALPSLPYLSELIGQPARHIHRELGVLAGVLGLPAPLRWRTMMLTQRLALATSLLSAAGATPTAVAHELHYRFADGLPRAFTNAGFPHPNEIRASLLRTAADLGC